MDAVCGGAVFTAQLHSACSDDGNFSLFGGGNRVFVDVRWLTDTPPPLSLSLPPSLFFRRKARASSSTSATCQSTCSESMTHPTARKRPSSVRACGADGRRGMLLKWSESSPSPESPGPRDRPHGVRGCGEVKPQRKGESGPISARATLLPTMAKEISATWAVDRQRASATSPPSLSHRTRPNIGQQPIRV